MRLASGNARWPPVTSVLAKARRWHYESRSFLDVRGLLNCVESDALRHNTASYWSVLVNARHLVCGRLMIGNDTPHKMRAESDPSFTLPRHVWGLYILKIKILTRAKLTNTSSTKGKFATFFVVTSQNGEIACQKICVSF